MYAIGVQLKKVRSLLIAGAANFDELYVHLRLLEPPFQTSVKDLRYVVMMQSVDEDFNLLKTKSNLLYIRNQSVPRCKHFPPQL